MSKLPCLSEINMEVNKIKPETIDDHGETDVCLVNDFPTLLEQTVKLIIEKEGFINYKVNKQYVSTKNGNYLGVLYAVDVKGRTKNENKDISLFVKSIKPGVGLKIISISYVYKMELFAYKEVFKIFEELQEDANIPLENRYKTVKAYESNTEVIIMENLAKKGFNTYYRMDVVSLRFAEMSVQELAKFHALSFVLKEKRPAYFDMKIKPINIPFIFGADWQQFVESIKNMTIDFVDEEFKAIVGKEYDNIVDKFPRYFNDETVKACLCHGDYRPNNIMTKMENGEEQEIIPVDYQIIFYGCPLYDFLYFIYFCTDREFRKAHMLDLKNLYYETLKDFLREFDIDADLVYPRKEFERLYTEKLDYGLVNSLLFLVFMFVTEDSVPDLSKLNFQIDERFKGRLRGIIEEFLELGYLKNNI